MNFQDIHIILYSILCPSHEGSALYSILYTLNSILYTLSPPPHGRSTLYLTLYTLYCISYTLYSILHPWGNTLCCINYTLYSNLPPSWGEHYTLYFISPRGGVLYTLYSKNLSPVCRHIMLGHAQIHSHEYRLATVAIV